MRTALLVALLLVSTVVSAQEPIVTKVDDFSAKIVISNTNDKDGVKTTVSQEKIFTLDELLTAKTASETALKSWQDEATKAQENITLQTNQIALWAKLIKDMTDLGCISKPIEQPTEEVIK